MRALKRKTEKGKAVVLLSGGIDSATTLAIVKSEGYIPYALSFDYHQRHLRELESAKLVAGRLYVERHLIITFDLREIGGSALTSEMEVPKSGVRGSGSGAGKRVRRSSLLTDYRSPIPITYVPARNTIFLSFALGWAEVLNAADIFIGANAVDYSGYPDCRPRYLKAFENMANLATRASTEGKLQLRIKAPLLFMTKGEIIRKGAELGLDYSLTWSCYDPQPRKVKDKAGEKECSTLPSAFFLPCGRCDSCRFRAKGFREAGIKDPLLL